MGRGRQNLLTSAEQLEVNARWKEIIRRILEDNFGIKGPEPPALPAPV